MWPAFHNGVSAGLRIVRDMPTTDSTWIVYNKPDSTGDALDKHSHAGLLMALGLLGHLVCRWYHHGPILSASDIMATVCIRTSGDKRDRLPRSRFLLELNSTSSPLPSEKPRPVDGLPLLGRAPRHHRSSAADRNVCRAPRHDGSDGGQSAEVRVSQHSKEKRRCSNMGGCSEGLSMHNRRFPNWFSLENVCSGLSSW